MPRPPSEVSRLPSPEGGLSRLPPPSVSSRNCSRRQCLSPTPRLSSLPIPLRGRDPACGQAAGGCRAGRGWADPARTDRTGLCRHGAGGRRPRDRKAPRDPPAAYTIAGSERAPTAGRTGNSKCRETSGGRSPSPTPARDCLRRAGYLAGCVSPMRSGPSGNSPDTHSKAARHLVGRVNLQ